LKGKDGNIFVADMTGMESQEAIVVIKVIIILNKVILEEKTIKR
jgi:hypothetical protein